MKAGRVATSLVLGVSAATGFIALAYEILWYRVFSFVNSSSPLTFGLLLGVYLAGLALGALVSRAFCTDREAALQPKAVRALAAFVFFAQVAGFLVIPAVAWTAVHAHWSFALGAVLLAATLLGASLPLLAHFGIAPDDRAGVRLSYVYLANIIGSAAGSLIVGFVLLDRMPIAQVALSIALTGLALVFFLLRLGTVRGFAAFAGYAGAAGAALSCWFATPVLFDRLYEKLQFKGKLADDFRFARVVENKSGVITVAPGGEVYGGGAYDGIFNASIVRDRNGIFRSYALGAMRPHYKEALMIGLASGSWAQVVVNLPDVQSLTIIEINPGYADIIRERPEVSWLLDDPRVHLVIDDGRRWLARHPEKRFDLLVMNTTWHWRAHATNLLSKDFMDLAKQHLESGGVFFFNTTHSEDVLVTAAREFPYALRVYNFIAASDQPLEMERGRWRDLLTHIRVHGELAIDPTREEDRARLDELVSYVDTIHEPPENEGLESRESLLERLRNARTVTDDNMVPEWRDSLGEQMHR